jgi:hypothetical protein
MEQTITFNELKARDFEAALLFLYTERTLDDINNDIDYEVLEQYRAELKAMVEDPFPKLKFVITKTGGYDLRDEEFDRLLGWNPVKKYWTYYEYFAEDQVDIFGEE